VQLVRALPVLSLVLVTGCGVAGTGFHPGIAAQVGDDTITTKHIDQVTDDYCTAVETVTKGQPEAADQQAQPMRYLTREFANDLIIRSAAEQLAETYDVKPTSAVNSSLAKLEPELVKLDDEQHDAVVEVIEARAYAQDVLTTIGAIELAKDGNSSATDEDKYAAGQDVLEKWIADHDVEVNPKYGLDVGSAAQVDTDLSYPLGKTARGGLSEKVDPAYAASLPDHLVCLE